MRKVKKHLKDGIRSTFEIKYDTPIAIRTPVVGQQ